MSNKVVRTGKNFNCQTCGSSFYRAPWQIRKYGEEKQKFCSLDCRRQTTESKEKNRIAHLGKIAWNKGTKGVMKPNKTSFKKGFVVPLERIEKLRAAWSGANHHNWKGGITPEVMRIRNSNAMKEWRKRVFERDKFTCQICFRVGGKLNADHIKPFAYFPDLRLLLENGRTLCLGCHKTTDTYLSKAKKFIVQIN